MGFGSVDSLEGIVGSDLFIRYESGLLSFATLQASDLLPKRLSSYLASIGRSVNKSLGIEVIFRSIRALPPLDKALIEQRLKTVIILIVLERPIPAWSGHPT